MTANEERPRCACICRCLCSCPGKQFGPGCHTLCRDAVAHENIRHEMGRSSYITWVPS